MLIKVKKIPRAGNFRARERTFVRKLRQIAVDDDEC